MHEEAWATLQQLADEGSSLGAWQRLVKGNHNLLFAALRAAVRQRAVAAAETRLREDGFGDEPCWAEIERLLACAQIAALARDGETVAQLPALLRRLDPQAAVPAGLVAHTASQDETAWWTVVRAGLSPLGPEPWRGAWAWDAVTALAGRPRPVLRSAESTVLLVERTTGEGVVARLSLEWLGDGGQGQLYPDAATMTFVTLDEDFRQAVEHAQACVRTLGLWRTDAPGDVRWRLARQDGRPLYELTSSSAGAAFALMLGTLCAREIPEHTADMPQVVSSEDRYRWRQVSLVGIAVAAQVAPDGRLSAVGAVFEKLLEASQKKALPRINTVVMAEAQRAEVMRIDPRLLSDVHTEFRVLCAATLVEAVRMLVPGTPPGLPQTWVVAPSESKDILQIAYGSGTNNPQYGALHLTDGYFRLNYGPTSGWGTSVILPPVFWSHGHLYQGTPVTATWEVRGRDLVLSIRGTIARLTVSIEVRLSPPSHGSILARVTTALRGSLPLDTRPGEAFKPVMLSSMHVSPTEWDTQAAWVMPAASSTCHSVALPPGGWILPPQQPVVASSFGLLGGTSQWKPNAPTIAVELDRPLQITGWVTPSEDPNDNNVALWAASRSLMSSWSYKITASSELSCLHR